MTRYDICPGVIRIFEAHFFDTHYFEKNMNGTFVSFSSLFNLQKLYNQNGGADHLLPTSELPQPNINSFNAEHGPYEHYEQRGQRTQAQQQRGQHDQHGNYEPRRRRQQGHPREPLSNKQNRGQTEQPDDHKQPDQYDRQGPRKQREQFKQLGQNKQLGENKRRSPYEIRGEPEQRGRYEQPGQREQPGNYKQQIQYKRASEPQGGPFENRGQLPQSEQFEQGGQHVQPHQYDQLGPGKQREERPRTERRYQHVGRGPHQQHGQYQQSKQYREVERYPVQGQSDQREFDEKQEQLDIFDEQSVQRTNRAAPSHAPVRHADHSDWPAEYYNKQRETYEAPMLRRPFGDLRGNYKEQYPLAQEERADNSSQFHEQELSPEDKEAFERQEMSDSEDDGSDFSESQKQPRHHQFRAQARMRADTRTTHTTRLNRLQYYTPPPTRRSRTRVSIPLTYHEDGASPERGPRSRAALDHNLSENNVLYYEDDHQLQRRKNDMSPDEPTSDKDQSTEVEVSSPQPSADSRHSTAGTRPSPGSSRASLNGFRTNSASLTGSRHSPVVSRTSSTSSRTSTTSSHMKLAHRAATTSPPDLARTERARSYVVTVSANNVTYKILTVSYKIKTKIQTAILHGGYIIF